MRFKACLSLTRGGILDMLQWRAGIFLTFVGNIIYLVIIYNLWQAIFASSETDAVNGMTFTDTMVYLVLAMTVYNLLNLWIVWDMSSQIQSGEMILNLVKPIEFRKFLFFSTLGANVANFFMVFIPTFFIVSIITAWAIPLGFNLLLFLPALIFALVINYYIDFLVGTICLYTESTWGIEMAKEVVVLLLSGAVIPIAFFPEMFRNVVEYLPFQAIYNVPLQILTNDSLSLIQVLQMYGVQLFWLAVMYVISGLFWKKSIKIITVNGG
jgi:ABC-2 type transport system permease protein